MTGWLAILIVGAGSYALRWSGLSALAHHVETRRAQRLLAHVAPAALGAIVASAVLAPNGELDTNLRAEHLAVLAAMLIVRRTGNLLHALLVGLPIVWLAAALA